MKKLAVLLIVLCFAATAKAADWRYQQPQQNYPPSDYYQQQQLEMQRREAQRQYERDVYNYEMQQRQQQGRTYDAPVRPYRAPSSLF